jgi:hypothetical protein
MLDTSFSNHPDYKTVFFIPAEDRSKRVQCARVAHTEARLWVRLVGQRHDLQLWEADSRGLDSLQCKRGIRALRSGEQWLATILTYAQEQ